MVNITLQEKKYRTSKKLYLTVTRLGINWSEVKKKNLHQISFTLTFKAMWDGEEWYAEYLADNRIDFTATTINGIKKQIRRFYRKNPLISNVGLIIIKYK